MGLKIFLSLLLIAHCNSETGPEFTNPEQTSDGETLYEGDMILSEEQYELFYGEEKDDASFRKSTSIKNMLWPDGIVPYKISLGSIKERAAILTAMQIWMNHTCLQFKEIPVSDTYKEPHLIFVRKSGDIGRKFWKDEGQEVSLGYGCENVYKMAHEIGHAIGFHHEHSRPDRDDYLKIFPQNYDAEKKENFKKQTYVDNYQIPYDPDSVMQYSVFAFSNNDNKTMAPHDPTKQYMMGQRDHLSFYDVKLANAMYKCSSKCDSSLTCENEGFLDSNCKCVCKPRFSGVHCENVDPHKAQCGGIVTEDGTVIKSPGYPSYYTSGTKCIWWIKSPENQNVQVTFKDFNIFRREDDTKADCYFDKMEVRTKNVYFGDVYCSDELKGKTITSDKNELVLLFESNTLGIEKGFVINVKFV